ncbi:hypothetical protein [Streptomyces sp. NRRL S-350]|uniref:hypothetical protein n=1 Tax=Streptomyces sp. NRRL S-350 TaxID=1463902 RepID=UPI00131C3922|nr:hypothetical protein [Streptomyces sp. NRRL S-350]
MSITEALGGAEILAPVVVFAVFSLQRWKSGLHAAWREEAEAYRARAERLDEDVARLVAEVQALRRENAQLRAEIRSIWKSSDTESRIT